jgi:hypothetical protein
VKDLMVMDQGWCASAIAFRIREGASNDVKLAGSALILSYDFPGPTLLDGNATARLYFDKATTAEQRRELEAIFQGRTGGPMAVLASLVAKWVPSQVSQIGISESGDDISVTVGNFGHVKSHKLKNEAGRPMVMQGAGFAVAMQLDNETMQLAPSASRWSDPDMPRSFETKSGAVGSFTWAA